MSGALVQRGEAPVEAEAQLQVADVGLRDQHGGAERDLRAPLVLRSRRDRRPSAPPPPPPASTGRARSRPRWMWPDCSSPSRLPAPRMSRSWLASEKPAPSVSSDCSTLQALLGAFGEPLAVGRGEVGVGARLGAADAAAQLVELGQAEHVGAVHDQRVGVGDVEAGSRRWPSTAARRTCRRRRRSSTSSSMLDAQLAVGARDLQLRRRARSGTRPPPRGRRCAAPRRSSARRGSARAAAPRARSPDRTAR